MYEFEHCSNVIIMLSFACLESSQCMIKLPFKRLFIGKRIIYSTTSSGFAVVMLPTSAVSMDGTDVEDVDDDKDGLRRSPMSTLGVTLRNVLATTSNSLTLLPPGRVPWCGRFSSDGLTLRDGNLRSSVDGDAEELLVLIVFSASLDFCRTSLLVAIDDTLVVRLSSLFTLLPLLLLLLSTVTATPNNRLYSSNCFRKELF
jgi:hypothetical protein